MSDPFEALYAPVEPLDPDPRFATRLRARLVRALALPEGVDMPRTVLDPEPVTAAETTGHPGVIPYLAVADASRALAWYVEALGARPQGEPMVMPDGRIGHAELELGGGVVMLADEYPELGVRAPIPAEGAAVTLHLEVADVDLATNRAVEAGARLERPPADHPYGRNSVVADPFGHRWLLSGVSAPTPAAAGRPDRPPGHGEMAYVTLGVADTTRARAFFSSVLGWRFSPGRMEDGWNIEGVRPMAGMHGGAERPVVVPMFAVDDIDSAVARVRAAGGTATDPDQMPYGIISDCTDDQGFSFYLGQLG